jgi:2'-5' RNA ligase
MNLPEIEGAHSHRIFFALWPDAEVMSHLAALGHSLASPGSRPMRPHSLHLTLAFLGSVTSAQLARLLLIAEGIRGEAFELASIASAFGRGTEFSGPGVGKRRRPCADFSS